MTVWRTGPGGAGAQPARPGTPAVCRRRTMARRHTGNRIDGNNRANVESEFPIQRKFGHSDSARVSMIFGSGPGHRSRHAVRSPPGRRRAGSVGSAGRDRRSRYGGMWSPSRPLTVLSASSQLGGRAAHTFRQTTQSPFARCDACRWPVEHGRNTGAPRMTSGSPVPVAGDQPARQTIGVMAVLQCRD